MSAIQTRLNRQSESYNSNYEAMQALTAELEKKKVEALFQGEENARQRFPPDLTSRR